MKNRSVHVAWLIAALGMILLLGGFSSGCTGRQPEMQEIDNAAAADSFYQLAVGHYRQNQIINALRALQEAEKYDPNNAKVKNLFGLIHLGKKRLDDAAKYFQAALDIEPKFLDAYMHLAIIHMERKQWRKAIAQLEVTVRDIMYSRKDLAYDNLGWCYHQLGDNEKAIEYLIQSTLENPKLCHAWYNLGLVYKSTADNVEAMKAFRKAIEHCPENSAINVARLELGMIALKLGSMEIAREALSDCVAKGSETDIGDKCRGYLNVLPPATAGE